MVNLEQLEIQHQNEQVELEKKLVALRASISGKKVDKNQKKSITNKIEQLQRELEAKQEQELYELNVRIRDEEKEKIEEVNLEKVESKIEELVNQLDEIEIPPTEEVKDGKKKKNRQKARKERKELELLKQMEEAELEAQNQPNRQEIETLAIETRALKHNLNIHNIRPDGHCLYSAISDQLKTRHQIKVSVQEVRSKAANYIRNNKEEFRPFLPSKTGNMLSEGELSKYCDEIENTPTWGGQIEINALSKAFEVPITIVQDGSNLQIGQDDFSSTQPLTISYHRHQFGLGAHYNSLRPNILLTETNQ